jgi:transposase
MDSVAAVRDRFASLGKVLDERSRRLLAAAESKAWGRGGISVVSDATGMARQVIRRGLAELDLPPNPPSGRVRRPGGGRKRTVDTDETLLADLEKLIEPTTRGDPESALRWTCKSLRKLAAELHRKGHPISYPVVGELLHKLGYSLQANRKTKEGGTHPDRNAQFEHIHSKVLEYMRGKQPVISVDSKKKELVGDFRNGGREWRPKGEPEQVRVYDFLIRELGRATPSGIYDLAENSGWVTVGVDHDTASFAVETIRRWWHSMGKSTYPQAGQLLITADCGGSNGSRVRLWKLELQKLADETKLRLAVCHYPPGTRKWNKIEHRLFSFISQNWRGKPLTSLGVIVSLIAATTTKAGLKVQADLNTNQYALGIKVSKKEFEEINLHRDEFHGEWNYEIIPRSGGNVIS